MLVTVRQDQLGKCRAHRPVTKETVVPARILKVRIRQETSVGGVGGVYQRISVIFYNVIFYTVSFFL